jgi:hypothetical protein
LHRVHEPSTGAPLLRQFIARHARMVVRWGHLIADVAPGARKGTAMTVDRRPLLQFVRRVQSRPPAAAEDSVP